jgi:hypothetical protein
MDYDERETVIRIGEKTPTVAVWTCKRSMASRLKRKGHQPVRVSNSGDGREIAWWFEVPEKSIGLRVRPVRAQEPTATAL